MLTPGRNRKSSFILAALLATPISLLANGPAKEVAAVPGPILEYRIVVPLGALVYKLQPSNQGFYLMASAVNPGFDGWQVVSVDGRTQLLDASGAPPRRYPSRLSFRVTASGRNKTLLGVTRDPIRAACSLNDYVLGITFRLKIFRGLSSNALQPREVRSIGVPADVPYNERVYVVGFDLKDVPVSDRVVLEVLSPAGERIGKFHLDLY